MREQRLPSAKCRSKPANLLLRLSLHSASHQAAKVDQWSDAIRLADLEPRLAWAARGRRGADISPDFPPVRVGTMVAYANFDFVAADSVGILRRGAFAKLTKTVQ